MVDVNGQVDAVTRTTGTENSDAGRMHRQTLTQDYASPVEEVWEAMTTADRIARWFMPVDGDLHVGGRYQLVGNAGGTVQECSPPHDGVAGFRVTWEFGGAVSWLAVALTAIGTGATRLELIHTARADDVPAGFWKQYGPGATGVGWDSGLLGLALHLGGGERIAPEDAEAWMTSAEGRRFARAAADAWAAAQVADGADPEVAARAAGATYAFYTGHEQPR